ncbi:MAG: alanine racemase [Clostridia bacterium]|nr:alanine racemase [Clostridia bacterium]
MRAEKIISLGKIESNYEKIKEKVGGREVICVVKANAYGHGAAEVAKRLKNASRFAVATVDEALELRYVGIKSNIFMMGGADYEDTAKCIDEGIEFALFDEGMASFANSYAARHEKVAKAHIAVNTGMNRIGVKTGEVKGFTQIVKSCKNIAVVGVFTHFYESVFPVVSIQTDRLEKAKSECEVSPKQPVYHAASTGSIGYEFSLYGGVRTGLGLYGYGLEEVEPAMAVKSRVCAVNLLSVGESVGYNAKFVAKKPTHIAVVSMGYADGVPRSFNGFVLIGGKRRKVVGNICMDCCFAVVDDGVRTGDEAVFIGEQGGDKLTAEDFAKGAHTIVYEALTGFKRIKTRYC